MEQKQLRIDLGRLFTNWVFIKVICAHALQGVVFTAFVVTEQWYIVNELNASSWLGIVMMATAFPRLIFMLMGGVLTDRFNTIKIMLFSNLTRIVILVMAAVFYSLGILNISMVVIFAITFGILDAIFLPAATSLPPRVVEKELLVRVNAVQRMSFQISMMFGGIIGATVIATTSFQVSFLVIAGIILLSSLFLISIKLPEEELEKKREKKSVLKDMNDGLKFVYNRKIILTFIIIFLMTNLLFVGPIGISIPLIVNEILKEDALTLSFYQSSWAGGLLIGSTCALLLNFKNKRLLRSLLFIILQGITMILLAKVSIVSVHLILILIAATCASLITVPVISYIQENTEREMLGRVMGLISMASFGILPMAYVLVSITMSYGVTTEFILLICGITLALIGVLLLIWKRDNLKAC